MLRLLRLLTPASWIKTVGLFVLGGAMIGGVVHLWHSYVDYQNLKDDVATLTDQTEAVTRDIPKQQERARKERERVHRSIERASNEDDSDDPMPESTRRLFVELWGQTND